MEHEQERDRERTTYQLCRLGFGILSAALVLACVSTLLSLPRHFGGRAFLPWLQASAVWYWIDAPIVWGSLIGSYLLWARWNDPSWQRRSGLLVVMGATDAVLWLIEHGQDLGLSTGEFGHLWLRHNLGQALGWAEFALIASLACDVMRHLGVGPAAETGRATRSLAATGAAVFMLYFCQMTAWHRGWPLEWRRFNTLESLLLDLGSTMIWTITLIQVTALTIATTRQCSEVIAEIDRETLLNDPLRPEWERVESSRTTPSAAKSSQHGWAEEF
jgi:hypothetical protein